MKRFAPFVLAFALVFAAADSADAQTQPLRLGLTAGAVTSSVGGSSVIVGNWRWGGTAGVIGTFRPARQTAIGLEVNWTQKGGNDVAFSGFETQDLQLQYIEIPLTIGYVNRWSGWESGLYAGIQIGFQISCKVKGSTSGSSTDCDDTNFSKKTTDWTLPFGFFFAKDLGGSSLGLDIRYALGLSDIFENTDVRNRAWIFRAVWYTGIGN
jgi:hypothetical protein